MCQGYNSSILTGNDGRLDVDWKARIACAYCMAGVIELACLCLMSNNDITSEKGCRRRGLLTE